MQRYGENICGIVLLLAVLFGVPNAEADELDEVVKTVAAPCAAATYMASRVAEGPFEEANKYFRKRANKRRTNEAQTEFVRALIDGATTEDALVVYADTCVRLWKDAESEVQTTKRSEA